MLNSDDAERVLPPTDKRRREARQRGEVARSSELTASVVMLAASFIVWANAPNWAGLVVSSLQKSTGGSTKGFLATPTVETVTRDVGHTLFLILLPSFAILFLVGLAANLIQTGWIWNPATLVPRWRFQRVASWERIADNAGLFVRIAAFSGIVWLYVIRQYSVILSLGQGEPAIMLVHSARLIGELFIQVSTAFVLFGLINYGICYWQHEKRLMMTPEERRREQRDDEIDPRIKKQRAAAA